jgi:hypothetical protein
MGVFGGKLEMHTAAPGQLSRFEDVEERKACRNLGLLSDASSSWRDPKTWIKPAKLNSGHPPDWLLIRTWSNGVDGARTGCRGTFGCIEASLAGINDR